MTDGIDADTVLVALARPWETDATGEVFVLPPAPAQPVRLSSAAHLLWEAAREPATCRQMAARLVREGLAGPDPMDEQVLTGHLVILARGLADVGLLVKDGPRFAAGCGPEDR